MKYALIIIISLVVYSCSSDDSVSIVDNNNLLLGKWISPELSDTGTLVFTRANSFINGRGMEFKRNGEMIHRNAGFCGTPPLTYSNYDGIYNVSNDTLSGQLFNSHINNISFELVSITTTSLEIR